MLYYILLQIYQFEGVHIQYMKSQGIALIIRKSFFHLKVKNICIPENNKIKT